MDMNSNQPCKGDVRVPWRNNNLYLLGMAMRQKRFAGEERVCVCGGGVLTMHDGCLLYESIVGCTFLARFWYLQ